jgi:glutathione S-transferase
MSELILHEYPASPFSEKIRALLAYKQLPYRSVEIPVIMPKPDLTALTGGYRKTPVLQIGADVFCDTELIARVIETRQPHPAVFGGPQAAVLEAAARWTDSEFFRIAVGLAFQPKAVAANPNFQDPAMVEAFMRDRAVLTGGQSLAAPLTRAEAGFAQYLRQLDLQLGANEFLGGSSPMIVDFSTWHCCWFIYRQEVLKDYFDPYPNVRRWLAAMTAFSTGCEASSMTSEEALAVARAVQPAALPESSVNLAPGFAVGDRVQVTPTDYGFDPVIGTLLSTDSERVVLARDDTRTGELHVHFPRCGFELSPAAAGASSESL